MSKIPPKMIPSDLLDKYLCKIRDQVLESKTALTKAKMLHILDRIHGNFLNKIIFEEWQIIQTQEFQKKWEEEYGKSLALLMTIEQQKIQLESLNKTLGAEVHIRKKREEELLEIKGQLEEKNKNFSDFAYIVSHDLKMPLRGIKQICDWLLTDHAKDLNSDGQGLIDLLSKRAIKMNQLIEGVLTYSRLGREQEKKEKIQLSVILPELIQSMAPPKIISFVIQENFPDVFADKTRMEQLFQNLIGNAIKYNDKLQGEIQVGWKDIQTHWQFHVKDNGPGIPKDHFERIFEIFHTVGSKKNVDSTGIGLSVVKKIIELYCGKVWVESAIDQGTTFFFTIQK